MDEERSDGGGGVVGVIIIKTTPNGKLSTPPPSGTPACLRGRVSYNWDGLLDDLNFHAKGAESAKILSPFLFTLALEESQTSLRQEGAESLG